MSFIVHLEKQRFKFSCTHFTIFGEGQAERMHGHNYQVKVSFQFSPDAKQNGLLIDFNELKPLIEKHCLNIDEHILLPEKSKFLTLAIDSDQINVQFSNRHYSFPKEDVYMLPVENISSEDLAEYFLKNIKNTLPKGRGLQKISVTIEETRGQSVTYSESI